LSSQVEKSQVAGSGSGVNFRSDFDVQFWLSISPLEQNRFRLNRDFALSICSVA
jgi:hypothetical protein